MFIKDANRHCSKTWFACDLKPVVNRANIIQVIGRF